MCADDDRAIRGSGLGADSIRRFDAFRGLLLERVARTPDFFKEAFDRWLAFGILSGIGLEALLDHFAGSFHDSEVLSRRKSRQRECGGETPHAAGVQYNAPPFLACAATRSRRGQ